MCNTRTTRNTVTRRYAETPECVNPAEYVQYRRVRPSVTAAGTGLGVGGWVSGTLNTPAPMGAPGPPQGRGFSHFLGL